MQTEYKVLTSGIIVYDHIGESLSLMSLPEEVFK